MVFFITVATTVGTALAYYLVPMRSLGPDSWKIAAALMGRHIGGGNITSLKHLETPVLFLSFYSGLLVVFWLLFVQLSTT